MKINWKGDKELMDLVLGWRSEGKTFGEIVAALTDRFGEPVTRNQVAGFLDRNYEGGPLKRIRKKKVKKSKPKPKAAKPTVTVAPPSVLPIMPVVIESEIVAPTGDGVRLVDLTYFSCRWPLGDPWSDDFRFCGERKCAQGVYCEEHYALAYREKKPRTREQVKADHALTHLMLRINNRERKRA